jgi:ferric-dicitrate binding protein FerR (iron transport regulator)
LGFLAAREGAFFFRCGRFLGADFLDFGVVLVLVDLEDSGPKPKNAPGNERVLVFFDGGRVSVRCFSRCWLRFRPDLRRLDLRRGAMGFEVSATNQSFSGQTTGILYPSISSKGSRW